MRLDELAIQLKENRGKSAVLGGLTLVLIVFVARFFVGGSPKLVGAASVMTPAPTIDVPTDAASDADKKVAAAGALWTVLKEKRGLSAAEAFYFDPTFYTLDPDSKSARDAVLQSTAVAQEKAAAAKPVDAGDDAIRTARVQRAALLARVREDARSLIVQSTVVSNPPTAVINAGIYGLNDQVNGFRIVSIRARQIIVEKNGITLAIQMAK
jgi:hypothetical protein